MRVSMLITVEATKPGEDISRAMARAADHLVSGDTVEFSVVGNTIFLVEDREAD